MFIRRLILSAAMLAATASPGVAAPACDGAQGCSATASSAPVAGAVGKKPRAEHAGAAKSGIFGVSGFVAPQPRPELWETWLGSIYATDLALAVRSETDEAAAVQIVDAEELNEVDRIADLVRVVSADEVNEIDLAAETARETTGQAPGQADASAAQARPAPEPLSTSWIVGLVVAFGGTVAAASRLVVRRTASEQ
jgi:hypothetical protein